MTSSPETLAPLRGIDGGFTHDSIHRRLPLIIDECLVHNKLLPHHVRDALLRLRAECAATAPAAILAADADCGALDGNWTQLHAEHASETWDSAPWFFVENFFYARVRAAAGPGVDAFAPQKSAALLGATRPFVEAVLPLGDEPVSPAMLRRAFLCSLWGNKADLSLHTLGAVVAGGNCNGEPASAAALLADDLDATILRLSRRPLGLVVIVLDNCGLELLSDLMLVDALLRGGAQGGDGVGADRVTLYCKDVPVFVSDAMPRDVQAHITWLRDTLGDPRAHSLATRLDVALSDGRLTVLADPFWTSPHPVWDAPRDVVTTLASAALSIFKGDANYRRLLGDRHWQHATPFSTAVAYLPCPALALRTNKSGVVVGIPPEVEARAAAASSDWLTTGSYGVAQLLE